MNVDAKYFPEAGSAPRAAVDHLRAHPGVEISSADLAVLMRVEIKSVSGTLARAVDAGLLTKRRDGRSCYYSMGSAMPPAQATHDAIARMAVIKLKNTVFSSHHLAVMCHTTPDVIDAALDHLVTESKLLRIDVLRGGVPMFDYRYSAAWVPCDEDFKFTAPSTAPHPTVSPVAPPTSKRLVPAASPRPAMAPRPVPVPPAAAAPHDALAAGAELGRKTVLPTPASEIAPAALGWQVSDASLDKATLEASLSINAVPNILEADDMVMAMNSRGEFVIDLGGGDLVKFPPAQALFLKRFLDNTSVLEELAGQGAI